MEGSITRAGLVFIVYLFIMLILFFTLYSPINTILVSFQNLPVTTEELNLYIPNYIRAMSLVFMLGIATPIVWFIFFVFSREPMETRFRR